MELQNICVALERDVSDSQTVFGDPQSIGKITTKNKEETKMKRSTLLVLVLMLCLSLVMAACSSAQPQDKEETKDQSTTGTTELDEGEGDPTDGITTPQGTGEGAKDPTGPSADPNVNPEGDPGIGEGGEIGTGVEIDKPDFPDETKPGTQGGSNNDGSQTTTPSAPELEPTQSGDDFVVDFGDLVG